MSCHRRLLVALGVGVSLLPISLLADDAPRRTRLIGFLTTVTGGFEAIRKQLAGPTGDSGGTKKA